MSTSPAASPNATTLRNDADDLRARHLSDGLVDRLEYSASPRLQSSSAAACRDLRMIEQQRRARADPSRAPCSGRLPRRVAPVASPRAARIAFQATRALGRRSRLGSAADSSKCSQLSAMSSFPRPPPPALHVATKLSICRAASTLASGATPRSLRARQLGASASRTDGVLENATGTRVHHVASGSTARAARDRLSLGR